MFHLCEQQRTNEFFYNESTKRLYFYYNGTGSPPSDADSCVVPTLRTLFNVTAESRWNPVTNVTLRGITMTGTRYTYMDPHGVPSAGDFAIARSAAVQVQNAEGVVISDCNLTRLDGNGIIVSGYSRGTAVLNNTLSWIGDNGVVVWGITNETAANPLEGFDGTDGNHPQDTVVRGNVVREVGVYSVQSSWFFQAKAVRSKVDGNTMFNAPRNGIVFNDPFGGGDHISRNLAFSAMRETADGGTFNTWDRQPFLTTALNGTPSPYPAWRELSNNFFFNNYHMEMNIDTDDGSSWYTAHHNVLVGGEWAMKSDSGGHDNYQYNNLNIYGTGPAVFLQNSQLPGHEDKFDNNTIIQNDGLLGVLGDPFGNDADANFFCTNVNVTNTKMYTSTGFALKCRNGASLVDSDHGNSVSPLPPDADVIMWAKALLAVPWA